MDTCHARGSALWISAPVSARFQCILHAISPFLAADHCQSLRARDGILTTCAWQACPLHYALVCSGLFESHMLLADLELFKPSTCMHCVPRACRLTGFAVQVEVQRQKEQRRQKQLDSASRSPSIVWQLLFKGWLKCAYAFADHTRNALILSVFAFKVRKNRAYSPCTFLFWIATCVLRC